MNIDAHQHFWKYNEKEYAWIDSRMNILRRDYIPEDLEPLLSENGFSGSIAVQARQTTEETRWLLRLAEENEFIRAVVGWVDLCDQDKLRSQLDEFCTSPKFAGVRHVVHDEPDDRFMLRDDFLAGISVLKDYNLTYDLLLFPKHLPVAAKVVSMFPSQKFVIDHISKPLIKDQLLSPWKEDLGLVAENSNVYCKLSGMVTEADWLNHKYEDFTPFLDHVFKIFGHERLMIGSDWPVCLLAGNYNSVTAIVKEFIAGLGLEQKKNIMGLNCMEFYNVK